MAKKIGKIMFPNGKYMHEGEEKTRWLECGSLLETDKGFRIKLDALPVNMQEGWFSVFEVDNQQGQSQQQSRPSDRGFRDKPPSQPDLGSGGGDDDIPF